MNTAKGFSLIGVIAVMFFTVGLKAKAQEGLSVDGKERWQIIYYPSLPGNNYEIESLKTNTAKLINECYQVYDLKNNIKKKVSEVKVFEDKIEINYNKRQSVIMNFSDILDYCIHLKKWAFVNNMVVDNPYTIRLGHVMFTYDPNRLADAKKLADYLFFFQHTFNEKRFSSQLALFEPIAEQYRALKVKPAVSESLREFIVKANLFNQQKNYEKAIELYNKAIAIDQTAYSAAYSNIALLFAQIHMFDPAIYNMKKYLLLEPEATDARSAQDKIYEWKLLIGE